MDKFTHDCGRFWSKVSKRGPQDCWLWTGTTGPNGYGTMHVGSKSDGTDRNVLTHRLSYQIEHGAVPSGMHVLHRCDTPKCVNPAHLWAGTHAENMADKVAKGRHRHGTVHGERHHKAKLTEADVQIILERRASLSVTARQFGVSRFTISNIRSGKGWAHINAEQIGTDRGHPGHGE